MRLRGVTTASALALGLAGTMAVSVAAQAHPEVQRRDPALAPASGIHLIKHIIIITDRKSTRLNSSH